MTRDKFKLIHSDLIMQVQCIENDLKMIYAGMHSGDFDRNLDMLEKANLGTVIKKLKDLDYSDGHPDLSKQDYALLEQIREIRNYWCHQCYLDFIYIENDYEREKVFQKVAKKLHYDEYRTYDLFKKTEEMRSIIVNKYR